MKVSNVSLISLSLLLGFQGALPMETDTNKALKKAQKVGKIALKIGAGTATLGMYAFMGTAALTSLGITLGAAAALPFLYYARYIKPQLPTPGSLSATMPAPATTVKSPENPRGEINKPRVAQVRMPARTYQPKNRTSVHAKTAAKAAGIMGVLMVENDSFEDENMPARKTREQIKEETKKQAAELQGQLAQCQAQHIRWSQQYNMHCLAEFPRFEGAYQDMIGIIDGDVQDIVDSARARMHDHLAQEWHQSGCKTQQEQFARLARRMALDQMRLPK